MLWPFWETQLQEGRKCKLIRMCFLFFAWFLFRPLVLSGPDQGMIPPYLFYASISMPSVFCPSFRRCSLFHCLDTHTPPSFLPSLWGCTILCVEMRVVPFPARSFAFLNSSTCLQRCIYSKGLVKYFQVFTPVIVLYHFTVCHLNPFLIEILIKNSNEMVKQD